MPSHSTSDVSRVSGLAALLQRLRARLDVRAPAPPEAAESPPLQRPPPGRRSGQGSESVLPYLNEALQTRPGALDE